MPYYKVSEQFSNLARMRFAQYVGSVVVLATACAVGNYSSTVIGAHDKTYIKKIDASQTVNLRQYEKGSFIEAWLDRNYELLSAAETTRQLMPLVSFVRDYIRARDYAALEIFVKSVDYTKITVTAQMAIIRVLFGVKDKIPSWDSTLQDIKKDINSRGENADSVLHGIY